MPRINLSRISPISSQISRMILGISASLLVVAVALVGIEPERNAQPEATAPNTVVITKPPTTTSAPSTTTTQAPPTAPPTTLPAVDPSLPCQQWLPLALQIGWPQDPQTIEMLLRVMNRESRCRPEARSASSDSGLLQVNDFWCEPSRYVDHPAGWLGQAGIIASCQDLLQPEQNLRAGLAIWLYSLERNGNGWHPWRYSGPTE